MNGGKSQDYVFGAASDKFLRKSSVHSTFLGKPQNYTGTFVPNKSRVGQTSGTYNRTELKSGMAVTTDAPRCHAEFVMPGLRKAHYFH